MTRLALVGAGRWGRQLLRVFDPRCRVAQVCHRGSPETRAWLARHHPHVPVATDYAAVLRAQDIEAVVIATPIATHAALARSALEADKHVFVEKPMATNPGEAGELVGLAASRRRVLFVGHVFLYHPVLERIRQLTADDRVRFAAMSWRKLGTFEEDLFWNLVSHEVAIAAALFGERPTDAEVLEAQGVVTACDIASIRLMFEGGRGCVMAVNRCGSSRSKQVTLVTERGRVLAWDEDRLLRLTPERAWESVETGGEEPLALEAEAFLKRVGAGEPSAPGSVSGALVVEVIDRLLAARRGNAPVPVAP